MAPFVVTQLCNGNLSMGLFKIMFPAKFSVLTLLVVQVLITSGYAKSFLGGLGQLVKSAVLKTAARKGLGVRVPHPP